MTCSIYKVCNSEGVCLYVGKALNPKAKERQHKDRFKNGTFNIIRKVPLSRGAKAEQEEILRFKQLGQAAFNKQIPLESLRQKVRKLKIGKTLHVANDYLRQCVLRTAKENGMKIATRASTRGFNCTRMPE